MMESKKGRQKILIEEFNFLCDCIACSCDWPLVNDLPIKKVDLLNFIKQIKHSFDKFEVLKVINECARTLNKYSTFYPSKELCTIQKMFALALLKLAAPNMIIN